jgi:uncharacterized protein with HEPN domain
MNKVPEVFVKHIIESVVYLENHLKGYTKIRVKNDRKTYDAVVRELEIIGEACANLTKEFKDKFEDIPWKKIIGMRNKLSHEYWDVDINIVWEAAKVKAPELAGQLSAWLEKNK